MSTKRYANARRHELGDGPRRNRPHRPAGAAAAGPIEEIIDIAEAPVAKGGVNGLTLSEVARRLGVKPPSLYKYFDSLLDIYDAVFPADSRPTSRSCERLWQTPTLGSLRWSPVWRPAVAGRSLTQRSLQLMFWRPFPASSPDQNRWRRAAVGLQRQALTDAVPWGDSDPAPTPTEALFFLSILISGLLGQAMANDPGQPWGRGRFTPLFPLLFNAHTKLYPPNA